MDMTPQRWRYLSEYLREVFGRQGRHLAGLMAEAVEEGLPDIAVSADVGRLLMILTAMTPGRLAIEVGTLAGYSAIWIARGLKPVGSGGSGSSAGRLITIEKEPAHAAFAERQFQRAGVADRVEVRCGDGIAELTRLARELAPGSVDVVFLDAEKTEYPDYWRTVRPLIAVGGLILADNVCGAGSWWMDCEGVPSREAADQFNRLVAGDEDFEAVAVPLREGILIGRRIR
jgi:predicted O-methyltransferase YrrM